MKIIRKERGMYKVESHTPGKFWTVDLAKCTCSCPHYLYRLRKTKGECKHIKAVKEHVTGKEASRYDDIISYVRDNVFVDSIGLIEKFGQETIDMMINNGELLEEHGKVRLL